MCRRPRAATAFSAWRWSMALVDPGEGAVTYQRQPAKAAPEVLARQHMPLVRKIAWHVHGRVSSAMEVEDLIQVGMVALVERSEEHTSELQSLMRISYAVFCLKKKKKQPTMTQHNTDIYKQIRS